MSHWYIQDELSADTSWSQQSTYATWQDWLAPTNAGFLEASEDPFDLNVRPQDLDISPEKMQAGETKWTKESEPTVSWTDDDDEAPDWWYARPAPTYFYWPGEDDLDDPGDTLWYPIGESISDFYPEGIDTFPYQWTEDFYLSPETRFYIQEEETVDYWYIISEPEDETP